MTKKILKKLLDFRADNGVKIKFSSISLSCIWASQLRTCSTVAYDGIERGALPFPTTCQCSPVVTGRLWWAYLPQTKFEALKIKI